MIAFAFQDDPGTTGLVLPGGRLSRRSLLATVSQRVVDAPSYLHLEVGLGGEQRTNTDLSTVSLHAGGVRGERTGRFMFPVAAEGHRHRSPDGIGIISRSHPHDAAVCVHLPHAAKRRTTRRLAFRLGPSARRRSTYTSRWPPVTTARPSAGASCAADPSGLRLSVGEKTSPDQCAGRHYCSFGESRGGRHGGGLGVPSHGRRSATRGRRGVGRPERLRPRQPPDQGDAGGRCIPRSRLRSRTTASHSRIPRLDRREGHASDRSRRRPHRRRHSAATAARRRRLHLRRRPRRIVVNRSRCTRRTDQQRRRLRRLVGDREQRRPDRRRSRHASQPLRQLAHDPGLPPRAAQQ